MEILVFWLVVATVGAVVASNKGRSGVGWFLLCLLLTPLAILVLLALPSLKTPEPQPVRVIATAGHEPTKTCPQCAETVKAAAKICRFCHYEFPTDKRFVPLPPGSDPEALFTDARNQFSAESIAVIHSAESLGYQVTIEDKWICFQRNGGKGLYCYRNADFARVAESLK